MEWATKVYFCEAFESYLFGTPFAKPPSYKGYQALPTPFSSPSKRATTFHRRHLIKFKIFVNIQARAVKADFWKALPKLPNSHLYPPFLKGLSSFCEALFMPIGWLNFKTILSLATNCTFRLHSSKFLPTLISIIIHHDYQIPIQPSSIHSISGCSI